MYVLYPLVFMIPAIEPRGIPGFTVEYDNRKPFLNST